VTERRRYVATVAVLLAVTVAAGLLGGGTGAGAAPPTPTAEEDAYRVTDDGTRYVVHPDRLLQGCPGGKDCIPAIDDPRFQSAGEADWLADDDLVIGVQMGGETKAYPLRVLALHEVVNDEVGGEPVAVTYCPLCRSGLVFDRRVGGETLTFGVSGKLLNANLVLYDRQTETYWSQLNGSAVVGPQVPRRLTILPSTITTWGEWRASHPDTRVLSRNTGFYPTSAYASDPYGGYENSSRVGFGVTGVDDRLHPKTVVYGVAVGNDSVAYPAEVVEREGVVEDTVGGVPVLLVEDPDDGGVSAFVREVDGETLSFERRDGALLDQHGHRWSLEGEALEGPRKGAELDGLDSHGIYWFAWSEFHPDTGVYGTNGTSSGG
jgi:hypothetical protein